MHLKFCFLFIFYFLFIAPFNAQIEMDTLKQIWTNPNEADSSRYKAILKYYVANTHASPDSSLEVIDYHYELAKSKNSLRQMARAKNELSYVYYLKGELDVVLEALTEAENLLLQIGDTIRAGNICSNKGLLYSEKREYREAILQYSKALDIFQGKNLKIEETPILNNLGLIYLAIDDYHLAMEYFKKTLKNKQELNQINNTGSTWINIANTNNKFKEYNKALLNARKGIEICKKDNNRVAEASASYVMAKSFQALNQIDSAFHHIEKHLAFQEYVQNENKILESRLVKAELTFEENITLATQNAEAILEEMNETTPNPIKQGLYQLLYKCYKAQGKTDLSLIMLERSNIYSDSVAIEKNNNAIIKEAIQKDFEIKMHESQLENEKEKDKLKLEGLWKIISISLFLGLVILGILFFQRKKNKQNQIERATLLKELELLKNKKQSDLVVSNVKFELNREKIESSINRKINETDWKVLNILLEDPVITNKEIAQKAIMSVDGIGSSLIRMYTYFDVKKSKYKKISLLMDAIKISNKDA